ncbi:MAG: hypothetical protein ACM3OC_10205 [Deltaproteobacteria bacterium]
MVQGTIASTVIGAVFSDLFSSPAPSGPTPEQIEAQRRLEEQKRLEFQRSNAQLSGKLRGGSSSYAEDKNVGESNGLKLKTISSAPAGSSDTFRSFFGSAPTNAKVDLLRDPMAGAGQGLLDPAEYKKAISNPDLTQEERERLFLRTKVKPAVLDDHPMVDARAFAEKERYTDPVLDVAGAAAKAGASSLGGSLIEKGGEKYLDLSVGKSFGYDTALAGAKYGAGRPSTTAEKTVAAADYAVSFIPQWKVVTAVDATANAAGAAVRQGVVRYWASGDKYSATPVKDAQDKWDSWVADRNEWTQAALNRVSAGEYK